MHRRLLTLLGHGWRFLRVQAVNHGSGMRYRFRCTVSRENAYTSADGPGRAFGVSMTRTPGSLASSSSDRKPPSGIGGQARPIRIGMRYVRSDCSGETNRNLLSPDQEAKEGPIRDRGAHRSTVKPRPRPRGSRPGGIAGIHPQPLTVRRQASHVDHRVVDRLPQTGSIFPHAVGKSVSAFSGSEQNLTIWHKQRTIAFRIGDRPRRRAPVDGRDPEPSLALRIQRSNYDAPAIRGNIKASGVFSRKRRYRT